VWEKGLYASFPIASLTKLMTVLLIMEDISTGALDWQTPVPATTEASLVPSSKLWMKPGQVFTVRDLVKSAMISSANDACYLLGQCADGSEAKFVERMNEKAASLGMYNTYFSNTTGLPAVPGSIDNFSSPHDLLILSLEVLKNPEVLEMAALDKELIHTEEKSTFHLKNHNRLAVDYPEVDGLKTGYTRKAGFCIVATAWKQDSRLIGIVLGAPTPLVRNQFVAGMFDRYYHDVLCYGALERPKQKSPPVRSRKRKK